MEHPSTKGDVTLALSPNGLSTFATPVAEYLDELRSTPTPLGGVPVMAPGDRAREMRQERLHDGVPVADTIWQEMTTLVGKEEGTSD